MLVAVCVVHVNTLPCKEHSVSGTLPDKGCKEIHITIKCTSILSKSFDWLGVAISECKGPFTLTIHSCLLSL